MSFLVAVTMFFSIIFELQRDFFFFFFGFWVNEIVMNLQFWDFGW